MTNLDRDRRFSTHYAHWNPDIEEPSADLYTSALVVLDANVLLAFYEIGATARGEVLGIMNALAGRLWVPHQVGLEFNRNRRRVVQDRVDRFKRVKGEVKSAAVNAVSVLEAAIDSVVKLRERNRAAGTWDLIAAGVDKQTLARRLEGAMDPATDQLRELEADHDVGPADMQQADAIFKDIDDLLAGKVGVPLSAARTRSLVEEAVTFRYPNLIPPGFGDADKTPDLRAAGDYLLWRQTLIEVSGRDSRPSRVLVVTSDVRKSDWWLLDKEGKPLRAHPDLVQEMRDECDAELSLLSLSAFLNGARKYLSANVSDETVQQVVDAETSRTVDRIDVMVDLRLSTFEFEKLVADLLVAMGYLLIGPPSIDNMTGWDMLISDTTAVVPQIVGVEVKRFKRVVPNSMVREMIGRIQEGAVQAAIIVTTSHFANSAHDLSARFPIRLIDGLELQGLLKRYLDVDLDF